MPTGAVKWFNATKGFGFIAPEGGKRDVFVHITAVQRAGMDTLNDGQKVGYELETRRDGRVAATDLSSEMLIGEEVHDMDDGSVGTIDDLILDDQGAITNVIIDFGGFLGIGTSQVSVAYDQLTVLKNKQGTDVRVYIDATREQVQAQQPYVQAN